MTGLGFDPLLPWPIVAALALMAVLVALWALWSGLRGWIWRGLAGLVAALALAGPLIEAGVRSGLSDIVILIDDRSDSQTLLGRSAQTDQAVTELTQKLQALPNTEIRRITVGNDREGTLLGSAITRALAAEPEARVAGVIAVTDGRLHDEAMLPATAPAPVHVLLTGNPSDWDRRLVIEEAPAFALIGQPATIRLRIEDQGNVPASVAAQPATIRLSVDGGESQSAAIPPGVPFELKVTPDHAGQNVVSIGFDTPQSEVPELTTRNNSAAIQIEGVRDRLRVLLVSGEPHAGERTWRNLLKSDANVDLIHFTILRSPDNSDPVPVDEMSLIAFPTRELFMERIKDFDLIIFDRYSVRGILPPEYYDNIVRYVQDGGAVLVAAGPEMATVESLNLSPLGQILPGKPTGRLFEQPFLPRLTPEGERHPVTAGLPGAPGPEDKGPHWGRWLRMSQMQPVPGAEVVLKGAEDQPLLVLNRVGKGRVALLSSDQVWLWGRGFEGGGPQLELLRRIAHWTMKEPELEEETLLADVGRELRVTVTRRTMKDQAGPVKITGPEGYSQDLPLTAAGPGVFSAVWQAPGEGLYRLSDGEITRVVALGPAVPREFEQTVASGEGFTKLTEATQGGILHLSDGVPALRTVRPGRSAHGQGVTGEWIAITPREAATVTGRTHYPLLPGWAWLALIAGLVLIGWLREGRARAL
ncbi:hypothetical protein [Paracoccus aminophilus]|uniref:Glutamine amidotransferase domain-containing protein n=1 Tax=Paracoccus aminophilus JCM 7686 TaxID=1367847 RepID=S5XSS3_PARAH|nr:hypothetical protein [Paracoccus aminophilus]AGT08177.1 hypothetical protein JCM7686_1068 [Paracoccus aminophilus JCM 7686]